MSAQDFDTKIVDDGNTDSGFLSGPIDSLDSGHIGEPTDRISENVTSVVLDEDNPDSGLDLCTHSLSNLDLDDNKTPTQFTHLRDKQLSSQVLPPLRELFQQDEDGDTELHLAAVKGLKESVGVLIKLCPERSLLDVANDYRHTALHLAVMGGYPLVARMLVLAGASLAARDCAGRTPVHIAAETCHVDCLKALLAPVNDQPHKMLSAILNQKDYNGQTCVHLAATAGHAKTLQTLVYYGADINVREGLAGWTALHIAAQRGDVRLAQYLLEKCAGVARAARDYGGRTPRRLARRTKADKLFARLPTDSDEESSDDDDYDSEGETLFERLLSGPNAINVA